MKRSLLLLLALVSAGLLPLMAAPLEVGAEVPLTGGYTIEGKALALGPQLGPQYTLIYFFPKADTPGCTVQAKSLRDAIKQMEDAGIKVIGVSNDKPEDEKAFVEKYQLNFLIIADPRNRIINTFGVTIGEHGKAARQSFIIKDNIVVWRDLEAKPEKQVADAMRAVKELEAQAPPPKAKAVIKDEAPVAAPAAVR